MKIEAISVARYAAMIESGEPFSQANYGDGEWNCIFGVSGENCDGHQYYPDLGEALRRTLLTPKRYLHGIPSGMRTLLNAESWCGRNNVRGIRWVEKETLSEANWRGELKPLFDVLRTRRVMLVGAGHLRKLPNQLLNAAWLVEVPAKDCWREVAGIYNQVLRHGFDKDVILFSASMMTNVLVYRLFDDIGDRVTMLDMGAIFDPYCGVNSRKRYRDRENPERIKRNYAA